MADPAILFVKPKAIKPADKKALHSAGVIVVEVDDPACVKFVHAAAELSGGDLLVAAAKTIGKTPSDATKRAFAEAVCAAIEARVSGGSA